MLKSRRLRLFIALVALALLFPQGRGITLATIIVGALACSPFRSRTKFAIAIGGLVLVGVVLAYARWNARTAMTELVARAPDGTHFGEAQGKHGPIRVAVAMKSGKVSDLRVVHHGENDKLKAVVVALKDLPERIRGANSLAVDGVSGATETSDGVREAARRALASAMENPPRVTWLSRAALFLCHVSLERETFFQLAIILTVILFADFVVQGILVPDTGQALNCMNCQACVGVCPVRRVEDGVPLPMQLVTQTRLGNYKRVEQLAQYCVGCGQCAAKCPSGISPLNIAGSAVAAQRLREPDMTQHKPQEAVP